MVSFFVGKNYLEIFLTSSAQSREQLSYKSTRAKKKTMISYPWNVILRFDQGASFFQT